MREEAENALGLVVREGRVVVSSRHVARAFGKPHDRILKDVDELARKCSERFGRVNFDFVYKMAPSGIPILSQREEVLLSRDGFTLLAMGYTGEKAMRFKEAYIAEFNRMEREIQNFRIPRTLPEALRLAAKLEEERANLEEQNERLAPKALAWDATCSEGSEMSIQAAAKEMSRFGIGPRKLFELLARRKVLYRLDGSWVPMQRYIESGHFRVRRVVIDLGEDRQRSYCKTLVTPRGRDLIARVLADRLAV